MDCGGPQVLRTGSNLRKFYATDATLDLPGPLGDDDFLNVCVDLIVFM